MESGWMGKVIMGLLLIFSVISWAMILLKYQFLRRAERESREFLNEFRKTRNVQELSSSAAKTTDSPPATPFTDGMVKAEDRALVNEEIERALTITAQDEITYMERYMAFLGTTGTVGPLLGLFGTVWGIMDAFYGIGLKGAGDIGALAPGLAAALINTISGLFVAIPAVIAYNYFSDKIRDIAIRCDSFSMEYLSFLERNLLR